MIHPPQGAVDFDERLDGIALVLNLMRMCHDLRHYLLNETILKRKVSASELLGKDFVPEFSGNFIAGAIASHDLHGRVCRPIVFQREEREPQILFALHRIPREEMCAHLYAGSLAVLGYAVNNAFRATLIDVV